MKRYTIYILASGQNGKLTVGMYATDGLKNHIQHAIKKDLDRFTAKYHTQNDLKTFKLRHHVKLLVYTETWMGYDFSIVRFEDMRGWKRARQVKLIESENRDWRDIYDLLDATTGELPKPHPAQYPPPPPSA